MGTNQAIRDAQSGKQPAGVIEPLDQQRSLVAAATSAGIAEADVVNVLERIGASCEIEQVLANGPEGRSVIARLTAGSEIAWHRHTQSTNVYFCLEGTMVVETRGPDSRAELVAGQTQAVPPRLFHRVVGKGDCRFVVLYRDGAYDVRLGG